MVRRQQTISKMTPGLSHSNADGVTQGNETQNLTGDAVMVRFDQLENQGYDNLNTNIIAARPKRQRQRTKVAPTLAKVGYWGGFFVGCIAAASSGVTGRAIAVPGLLVGVVGAAVLGLIGLAIDCLA
jgi:hypothetical protein